MLAILVVLLDSSILSQVRPSPAILANAKSAGLPTQAAARATTGSRSSTSVMLEYTLVIPTFVVMEGASSNVG